MSPINHDTRLMSGVGGPEDDEEDIDEEDEEDFDPEDDEDEEFEDDED